MATIVIFLASLLFIFFFLLGVLFKGMAAMFYGMYSAILKIGNIVIWGMGATIVFGLVYYITHEIMEVGPIVFGYIVLLLVLAVLCLNACSRVGFGVGRGIGQLVLIVLVCILEMGSSFCENRYVYFLQVIAEKSQKS